MSNFHWSLLILYLTVAGGYGGWRGRDLWSDGSGWCLLLPLLAWEVSKLIGHWRRQPYWVHVIFWLVMTVIEVVAIGGFALLLTSWAASESAKRSTVPAVRAAASALVVAVATTLSAFGVRKQAKARATKDAGDTENPADPSA